MSFRQLESCSALAEDPCSCKLGNNADYQTLIMKLFDLRTRWALVEFVLH